MKLTKKIIVAVLALALLASSIVSSVFAVDVQNDPFSQPGIDKIDDILEYYACNTYIAEDYEKEEDKVYGDMSKYTGTSSKGNPLLEDTYKDRFFEFYDEMLYLEEEYYMHESEIGIVKNPVDSNDNVLMADIGVMDMIGYARSSSDKKAFTQKVFFTFDVYFDESCKDNISFSVKVSLEGKSAITILEFDFLQGDSSYKRKDDDGKKFTEPVVWIAPWSETAAGFSATTEYIKDFTPKFNTWYSIDVCFNTEDARYSIEILEGEQSVANVEYNITGAKGIAAFDCNAMFKNTDKENGDAEEDPENPFHALMYLDDVEIYEGSYRRNPAQKEEISRVTLQEIKQLYLSGNCTPEDKLQIADVLYELLGYDETAILGYLGEAKEYVNAIYANETIERISKIDSTKNYYDRVDYIENVVKVINDRLTQGELTELAGVSADVVAALNAAREVYAAETKALAEIMAASEGFIAAIKSYDPTNKDYNTIVEKYKLASSDEFILRSDEYIGVIEAEEVYAALEDKYTTMVNDVDEFVTLINSLKEKTTFGAYYNEYKNAKIAYYQYDEMPEFANGAFINPDLDTSTHAELAEAVKYYEDNEAATEAKIVLCDAFNTAVLMASSSDYYPTLGTLIADADKAYEPIAAEFEYLKDYKGLGDGLTLEDTYKAFEALKKAYVDKKTATDTYINAVNAINGAIGFYNRRDAVNLALSLKAAGDNLAIEGVLEANLALAKFEAEINLLQGNSESLIALVAALEEAESIEERRALVNEASLYIEGATTEYRGVNSALSTLEKETKALEDDIAEANEAIMSAIKNAIVF